MTTKFLRKHVPLRLVKAPIDGAEDRIIEGYASTFESPERHDSYGDVILPGAFKQSIEEHNSAMQGGDGFRVKLFLRHQIGIGSILEMREDKRGLWFRARVSETRDGDEALTLARDHVLDSVSIGFNYEPGDAKELEAMTPWGYPVRAFTRVRLKENSLVEIPANEFAQVTEVRMARKSAYDARRPQRGRAQKAAATKGLNLGVLISKLIWKLGDDAGMSIEEALDATAVASGLAPETIREIMQGADACPTLETLGALADALDDPLSAVVAAAQADGCEYDMDAVEAMATTTDKAADMPQAAEKAETFGAFLSAALMDLTTSTVGFTEVLAELADEMEMTTAEVQAVLDGEAGCPTLELMEALSFLLDLDMGDLVEAAEADGCVYGGVDDGEGMDDDDDMNGEMSPEMDGPTMADLMACLDEMNDTIQDLRDMLVAE